MKDVIPLLSTLPLREEKPGEGSIYPRPILYAAENDHKVCRCGGVWRVYRTALPFRCMRGPGPSIDRHPD